MIELAKDIQMEFIGFVDDLMLFLVEMLEWKETNLFNMKTVFSAFSWLFKHLEIYLTIDDVKKYYKTYFVRFMANKNYYVRDFMAEVFGVIFRSKIMLNDKLTYSSKKEKEKK